jgi:hypothetical protein
VGPAIRTNRAGAVSGSTGRTHRDWIALTRPRRPGNVAGMNRRRRTVLLLGLALVPLLLFGGVVIALLWLMPSEAERRAAMVEAGMTWLQTQEVALPNSIGPYTPTTDGRLDGDYYWTYADGSILIVTFGQADDRYASSVRTSPPPPADTMTRLRRTLARLLPFLGE